MSDRTVHAILTTATDTADDHEAQLRSRLETLIRAHGRPSPRPFTETDAAALDHAARALSAADAEAARLAGLRASLTQAEVQLAQASKGANGTWVLLATLALIVIIVIVGQGVW